MSSPPLVVALAELTQMLGVTKNRAMQVSKKSDFPAPVAELSVGRVWSYEAVEHPARTAHADASATIDAGSRLRMNAPRDMIATHGDSASLERGRFINPGHGVNLIKVCTLEVQARE